MIHKYIRSIVLSVVIVASAVAAVAQVELLGFSELVQGGLRDNFPSSKLLNDVISQIPAAVGNYGTPIVKGLDLNGNIIGDGTGGSTVASANVNLGDAVSTSIVWTATATWSCYRNADGYVHVKLVVVWGTNSKLYTREIDLKTTMPNETAASAGAPIPTVITSDAGSAPPSSASSGGGGSNGTWQLNKITGTFGFNYDGKFYVVGYTRWEWTFVADSEVDNHQGLAP